MNLLIVLIVVLLIVGLPTWPYSQQWGYTPAGTLLMILLVILFLRMIGVI